MQHLTHLYAGTWRVAYTESMAARRRASVTPGLSLMSLSVALTLVLVLSNTWPAAAEDGGTQTRMCITCLHSREPCADIRFWISSFMLDIVSAWACVVVCGRLCFL